MIVEHSEIVDADGNRMANLVARLIALLDAAQSVGFHVGTQATGVGVGKVDHLAIAEVELDAVEHPLAKLVFADFHFTESISPANCLDFFHNIRFYTAAVRGVVSTE